MDWKARAGLGLCLGAGLALVFDIAVSGLALGVLLGLVAPEVTSSFNRAAIALSTHSRSISPVVAILSVMCALGLCVGSAFIATTVLCHGASGVCDSGHPHELALDPLFWSQQNMNISQIRIKANGAVVATWAGEAHFARVLNLIASVQFWEPDMRVVVWDLGLSEDHVREISCLQNVEVAVLDSQQYPEHLSRHGGMLFKPILVERTLQDHHAVIWLDAEVEVRSAIHRGLHELMRSGHYFVPSREVLMGIQQSVADQLKIDALKYKYKTLFTMSVMGFVRDSEAFHSVLLPTIECAVDVQCIGELTSEANVQGVVASIFSVLIHKSGSRFEGEPKVFESHPGLLTRDETSFNNVLFAHRGQSWFAAYQRHLKDGECPSAAELNELKRQKPASRTLQTASPSFLSVAYHSVTSWIHAETTRAYSCWLFWCLSGVFMLLLFSRAAKEPPASSKRAAVFPMAQ